MKIFKFGILLIFSVLISVLVSCNDDPTSLGTDLLPDSDFLNLVHVNSKELNLDQKAWSFTDSISTGGSSRILLGKYGNVESWMLIKFFYIFPDSLVSFWKDGKLTISKTWVELKPDYLLGDSVLNNFSFEVRRIKSSWSSASFNLDSLNSLVYDAENLAGNLSFETDSLIRFDLPTEIPLLWLTGQAENSSTIDKENGILFIPNSSNMVLGFQALAEFTQNPLPQLKIVVEKSGAFTDTLTATPTSDIHIVKGTYPKTVPGTFVLQDGLPVRAKFWIDLNKIPAKMPINKATLTFFVNKEQSVEGSIKSDSLALYVYSDSLANKINKNYGRIILKRSSDTYTGDVTSFVQRWINGIANEGIRINLTDESRALSKIVLYSNEAADTSKRPLLEIDYIKK